MAKGTPESAIEVTLPGDSVRSFRRPPRLLFCKGCCLVLTPACAEFARKVCGPARFDVWSASYGIAAPSRLALAVLPKILVPKWDRDRQELRMGSILVKQFKVPAVNQEIVLAAFRRKIGLTVSTTHCHRTRNNPRNVDCKRRLNLSIATRSVPSFAFWVMAAAKVCDGSWLATSSADVSPNPNSCPPRLLKTLECDSDRHLPSLQALAYLACHANRPTHHGRFCSDTDWCVAKFLLIKTPLYFSPSVGSRLI